MRACVDIGGTKIAVSLSPDNNSPLLGRVSAPTAKSGTNDAVAQQVIRLIGEVCEMSGIEPAAIGYYIVKGAGIPRIDIVGSQGRVSWNQLMSSIATADFGGTTVQ